MGRMLCSACLLLFSLSAMGAEFVDYLEQVRAQAVAEGISESTVDEAFKNLTPDERVIGFDRKQPEFVQTFDQYLEARVSDFRQQEGKRLLQEHKALLARVTERYGVEAEFIVAFWGLETSFGRYQGKYSIIRSLATLGHDPRRATFFTSELIHALRILDQGHVKPESFVGAWAGAMGQSQFLPSSFLRFAQDFDGDGRKNIWQSEADVFASIANYLNEAGWREGAGWGGRVSLPALDFDSLKPETYDTRCRALRHHSRKLPLAEWQALGVVSKGALPDMDYALVEPEDDSSEGYLAGGNYRAILNYNCANKYAVSVGLLADIYLSR